MVYSSCGGQFDNRRFLESASPNSFTLGMKLYDTQGQYVVYDIEIAPDYDLAGMLFSFNHDGSLRVENAYLKPEHFGQGIGK